MRVLSGKHKSRVLKFPRSSSTRPITNAAKEKLFAVLLSRIDSATVLDLYAGSGAIGIEALSRGCSHVTFVEVNHLACECIKFNVILLDELSTTTIYQEEAEVFLKRANCQFDLIFAAPPYRKSFYSGFLGAIDRLYEIIGDNGTVVIETNRRSVCQVQLTNLRLERELYCRDTLFQFWITK